MFAVLALFRGEGTIEMKYDSKVFGKVFSPSCSMLQSCYTSLSRSANSEQQTFVNPYLSICWQTYGTTLHGRMPSVILRGG
jgi:hypothetical protein